MAQSPAHRFGQIIGDALEAAIRPILEAVANELGMYLDAKGERVVRGKKRKVAWIDGQGNSHDLDYVFESDGSAEAVGDPRAFIEIAWRRYTKHSRNKAQEIQGAILPLAERYADHHPFLGVVLGGEFTAGSLAQLRSNRFFVLYFPYESVVAAFATAGVDAAFDEETPDRVLQKKVNAFEKLSSAKRESIATQLRKRHKLEINTFTTALRLTLTRKISTVYVLPLHGSIKTWGDLLDAIAFIQNLDESSPDPTFERYEVGVRFSNGDEVRGQFREKAGAILFLQGVR